MTSEFGEAASKATGLLAWARIPDYNSERDVHRVIKRQGLSLDLSIDTMTLGSEKIAWISPRTWLTFIVQNNLWCRLCGLSRESESLCGPTWLRFWDNFKKLHPTFELFNMQGIDLSRTAAFYVHGDEGRGLKHTPFMVTNLQSALGHGSGPQTRKHVDEGDPENSVRLKLNLLLTTYVTRLITLLIPKNEYENPDTDDMYLDMLDQLGRDLEDVLSSGVSDKKGNVYRICVIGVKGDLPFLARVSFAERTWNRSGGPSGVCHLCRAGQPQVPFEQAGGRSPFWLATEATAPIPWSREPPLTKWLVHEQDLPAHFYKLDIWHCFHLGLGRGFCASVIVLCMALCASTTIGATFRELTANYLAFCKGRGLQAYIRKITRDLVCYGDPAGVNGFWSKGSLTTNFMLWLQDFLEKNQQSQHGMFSKALKACRNMNLFFSCLYDCDAFLNAAQCAHASACCRTFLSLYVELARDAHQARKLLFRLVPKVHFMDHFAVKLYWDGLRLGISENPLQAACQMDEDAVGHLSRTSRRVSIRCTVSRSFDRYVVACQDALREAGWIY